MDIRGIQKSGSLVRGLRGHGRAAGIRRHSVTEDCKPADDATPREAIAAFPFVCHQSSDESHKRAITLHDQERHDRGDTDSREQVPLT
jgi:hypothetical protein